jgi:hypothetical protein
MKIFGFYGAGLLVARNINGGGGRGGGGGGSGAGTTWTPRTSEDNHLSGVAYGNGTFVAVGGYGTPRPWPHGSPNNTL